MSIGPLVLCLWSHNFSLGLLVSSNVLLVFHCLLVLPRRNPHSCGRFFFWTCIIPGITVLVFGFNGVWICIEFSFGDYFYCWRSCAPDETLSDFLLFPVLVVTCWYRYIPQYLFDVHNLDSFCVMPKSLGRLFGCVQFLPVKSGVFQVG